MKNFLLIVSLLITSISTVTAAEFIKPGMVNDFEDGSTMDWENGARRDSPNKPSIKKDGDNSYLEIKSLGGPAGDKSAPNARMGVSNATYTIVEGEYDFDDPSGHVSKWAGDYSNVAEIKGRAMATSDTEEKLYLRLGVGDYRTGAKAYYTSKKAIEIPTDGTWVDFSFKLDADFVDQGLFGEFNNDFTYARLIKDVPHIRFVSNKENSFYGGDRIKATLGLDDISVISKSPDQGDCLVTYSGSTGLVDIPCLKIQGDEKKYRVKQTLIPDTLDFRVDPNDVVEVK
jgi:hypothetical protein